MPLMKPYYESFYVSMESDSVCVRFIGRLGCRDEAIARHNAETASTNSWKFETFFVHFFFFVIAKIDRG